MVMATNDVKMYYIDDDIKKVQVKTNLYIQQYGPAGAFHLSREVIQNAFDECTDPSSQGTNINITYDKKTDKLIVEDDGRGFSEADYPLDIFCTKLQSGSKFFRDQGGNTSGEFGVGLTAVNALSSYFRIASYREAENTIHDIIFENGVKVSDKKRKRNKTDKIHGTIIEFISNPQYLGTNVHLPFDDVYTWIEKLTYQLSAATNKKVKISIEEYNGTKLVSKSKLKSQPFENLINKMINKDKVIIEPFSLEGSGNLVENVTVAKPGEKPKNVNKKKDVILQAVFAYEDSSENINVYDSYCNYTNTVDGGVHVTNTEEAFCRFIQTETTNSMTEKEREKWNITWADVRSGLVMLLNLSTNAQVQFVGNAKKEIANPELGKVIKIIADQQIKKYFEHNQSKLQNICKIVKLNARTRIESQKLKTSIKKERMDSFSEHAMKNFTRCNNTGKQYKELYIIEGQRSASGSATNGRYPDFQAIYALRGVTANPFKCTLAEIMENEEWKGFVNIIRTGIGQNFKPEKCYYDKIILMTDADVDGYYISAGFLGFIILYMPELISMGKIYKVFSPLYNIDDKEHPYVGNKYEFTVLIQKKIAKQYKIGLLTEKDYLNKDDVFTFLLDSIDYRGNLIRLYNHFGKVDKYLIELIAALLIQHGYIRSSTDFDDMQDVFSKQKFITNFMGKIQQQFPEIRYVGGCTLRGVIDGRFYSIQINNRFIKKLDEIIPVIQKYGYLLKVKEKNADERIMCIGKFLDESYKLTPKIITRYKGLGEADSKQIRDTTMNTDNQILVQYSLEDVEKDLEVFRKLQGHRKKDAEARKEMMKNYKIRREDLDN